MPLRPAVRTEVRSALNQSPEAKAGRECGLPILGSTIKLPGKDNDVTPYLSLALDLGPAPEFAPAIPEADLAPDAGRVLGVVSPLKKFYQAANVENPLEKASTRIPSAGQSTPRSGFSAAYPDRPLFKGSFSN